MRWWHFNDNTSCTCYMYKWSDNESQGVTIYEIFSYIEAKILLERNFENTRLNAFSKALLRERIILFKLT